MDVLITEAFDRALFQGVFDSCEVVCEPELWRDPSRLKSVLAKARTVMVRNQTRLSAELLEAAPNLLAIGRVGAGLETIDLEAANRLGIVVIAPLSANTVSVGELTLGLMLSLARKIPSADRSTKGGRWERAGHTGVELAGKTLLICGFGRIGRAVAGLAASFQMRLLIYDPYLAEALAEEKAHSCQRVSDLKVGLGEADFISVHVPGTVENHHLFNRDLLQGVKPGAFLINISRGVIVEEAALIEALESGRLKGAALDVREQEPPKGRGPLEQMDNVILTPHIGAFTGEAQKRTLNAVVTDLDRVLKGKPALNCVNFPSPRRGC